MKTLFGLLLLAAVSAAENSGRLYVHVSPGFEVVVDGTPMGVTTAEQAGIILDLLPGEHHIVVRSDDGREGAFDIAIEAGASRDITLSPLGLRKKLTTSAEDETGSVRVACIPDDCTVEFRNGTKEKRSSDDLAIDSIPPGQYTLTATRGTTALRIDVGVQKGMLSRIEANFTAGTIRLVDHRRRVRRVMVAEPNDALTALSVPAYWKSAIRSALPAGIYIARALVVGDGVRVTMRVPSEDVAVSLIKGVGRSSAFRSIAVPAAPRRDATVWVVEFIFNFPASQ